MKVVVEGEKYLITDLSNVFDDAKFYIQNGDYGTIHHVGYYHSFEKNELVYLLPKVFMLDNKVFGLYEPSRLFTGNINKLIKRSREYNWARQVIVYFYNSIAEYKKRYPTNSIAELSQTFELNTNLGDNEYTYLDLLLSFVNFYKKNKNLLLYHQIEFKSDQAKKPNWNKTIRKSIPIVGSSSVPIYQTIINKKKSVNNEEDLICYFVSIVNHFNSEHQLNITIDKSYNIIKGPAFNNLQKTGLSKLRKVKHRYFSDTLKRMYQLCQLYFNQTDTSSIKKKKEEYISVKNYNIVFEDMIDKLFSDKLDKQNDEGTSLDDLKYNEDGKIIDHIYEYQSLIDTSNIFYIGDSKYYKTATEAGKNSKYKQLTYAKNVVQFNIDLFNSNQQYYSPHIKYRDELTEGYNISPNFFIYGYISDLNEFDQALLQQYRKPVKSFHFKKRLFDRDTLFVLQYQINFLYVLKSYTSSNYHAISIFRIETKKSFRNAFIDYFNDYQACGFELFIKKFANNDLAAFVDNNFRVLNGKCIRINDEYLLVAKHVEDDTLASLLIGFTAYPLLK